MARNFAIPIALHVNSGKEFDISENFDNAKERFKWREKSQLKEEDFECLECSQKLTIASSKNDWAYFKHLPYSKECSLKNGSSKLWKSFVAHKKSKESPRHKYLKNEIGSKLKQIAGVTNLSIDDRFIIFGDKKRKPDVYCEYNGNKIAFEIQLSNLSLSYIVSRARFYQNNGIFLIWILDNFDVEGKKQMERDIKYLSPYQNFFKLDENNDSFKLICKFKKPFQKEFEVHHIWQEKSVSLSDLTFNSENAIAFYFDFEGQTQRLKELCLSQFQDAEEKREQERKKAEKERIDHLVNQILLELRDLSKKKFSDYQRIQWKISSLTFRELDVLNEKIQGSTSPILFKLISSERETHFINFILNCSSIELNLSILEDGMNCFEAFLKSERHGYHAIAKALLKRGMILSGIDISQFSLVSIHDLEIYKMAEKLKSENYIDQLFEEKGTKLALAINSLKSGIITFGNYRTDQWISFSNNLADHHNNYWNLLTKAMHHYNRWELLLELDKKGSFQRKVKNLMIDPAKQSNTYDGMIATLFPEIF